MASEAGILLRLERLAAAVRWAALQPVLERHSQPVVAVRVREVLSGIWPKPKHSEAEPREHAAASFVLQVDLCMCNRWFAAAQRLPGFGLGLRLP